MTPEPREEWPDEPVMRCDQCGEQRPCYVAPDPFVSEVYSDEGPYEAGAWCMRCYQNRKDDV